MPAGSQCLRYRWRYRIENTGTEDEQEEIDGSSECHSGQFRATEPADHDCISETDAGMGQLTEYQGQCNSRQLADFCRKRPGHNPGC